MKKSPFCYREWKDYKDPAEFIETDEDSKLMLNEIEQIEKLCEKKKNDWLPAHGLDFLKEERFAQNLLRNLDEDDSIAKIFSEYKPSAKPGSEADKLRNKSLARMGLLVDIKAMKIKSLARKWKQKAQESIRKKKESAATIVMEDTISNDTDNNKIDGETVESSATII